MPQRWIHETYDLIIFGKSYPAIHHQKDAAWKTLGSSHRSKNHELYNLYGFEWDFNDLYSPTLKSFFKAMQKKYFDQGDKAEEDQVWVTHDILDKIWDGFDCEERRRWASDFKSLLLDPLLLKEWAGVDVLGGKIKRRKDEQYGFSEPIDYWEKEASIIDSYRRLRGYVESKSIDELLYLKKRKGK